jgi:hypothetical protein
VKHEILGAGEGFMGEVVRLHLSLDRDEAGVPPTLIAKLPTAVTQNRTMGELLGAYEREILFYGELASGLPVRTPRVYYSEMNASPSSKHVAFMAGLMDKLPMWLIAPLMRLVTWLAKQQRCDYVLLIEDFSEGRPGDQVAGCGVEEAREVLRSVAGAHALHWGDEGLNEVYWLRRLDMNPKTMHSVFRSNSPAVARRLPSDMPARFHEALAWVDANGVELIRAFTASAAQTLQHCDLRLDNIFFLSAGESDVREIALFDWQLTGRGPGAYDVGYFLSGALSEELPSAAALELVRGYHEELLKRGVEGYDLESCIRDYHRALLIVLHRLGSTDSIEMGDGRGAKLVELWVRRLLARLEGVELDTLLR